MKKLRTILLVFALTLCSIFMVACGGNKDADFVSKKGLKSCPTSDFVTMIRANEDATKFNATALIVKNTLKGTSPTDGTYDMSIITFAQKASKAGELNTYRTDISLGKGHNATIYFDGTYTYCYINANGKIEKTKTLGELEACSLNDESSSSYFDDSALLQLETRSDNELLKLTCEKAMDSNGIRYHLSETEHNTYLDEDVTTHYYASYKNNKLQATVISRTMDGLTQTMQGKKTDEKMKALDTTGFDIVEKEVMENTYKDLTSNYKVLF